MGKVYMTLTYKTNEIKSIDSTVKKEMNWEKENRRKTRKERERDCRHTDRIPGKINAVSRVKQIIFILNKVHCREGDWGDIFWTSCLNIRRKGLLLLCPLSNSQFCTFLMINQSQPLIPFGEAILHWCGSRHK